MNYSVYDNLEELNEGFVIGNKIFKDIKKQIKATIKEVNGNDKFFTRLKNNLTKSKPSNDKINSLRSKMKNIFDDCYVSDIVVKEGSYTIPTGNNTYTTVYYDYYDQIFIGLKGNIIVRVDCEMNGSGFLSPRIQGATISTTNEKQFGVEDFKELIKFCSGHSFLGFMPSKLFKPKSITLKNEYASKYQKSMLSQLHKASDELERKYNYICKVSTMFSTIKVRKNIPGQEER